MADTYSDQITNQNAAPQTMNPPSDEKGRLRILHCDYIQDGVGTPAIAVAKLPPGRVRLLGALSRMYGALTAANFDLGWEAYTESDGDAVAADPDGLDDGVAVDTLLACGTVLAAYANSKVFDSRDGVTLIVTPADALADADSFYADCVYVND